MTELVWVLVGNTVFVAALSAAALCLVTRAYRSSVAGYETREKTLVKLLKDAQDRIHAASLSDYMAIRDSGKPPKREYRARTDEEEANIEEARMSGNLNGGGY